MAESAVSRVLRGVRAPWELLGRMRQEPRLWGRYWRTVFLQAGLTLVAGGVVFWVGKQGADAWRDAFGPDDPVEATASRPSDAPPTGPEAPSDASPVTTPPAAPGNVPAEVGPAQNPPGRPSPGPRGPKAPAPPPPPAVQRLEGNPPSPAQPPSPPPEAKQTGPAAVPGTTGQRTGTDPPAEEEDEADADETSEDAELEAQIEALKNAPPGERGKRTAELVAAAIARAKTKAPSPEKQHGKPRDAAEELASDRDGLKDTLEEVAHEAEALAAATTTPLSEARKQRRRLEHKLDQVEKDAAKLQRRGAPPLSAAERTRLEHARAALVIAHRHERGLAGRLGAVAALLAAIYASLGIAQVGVLAMSRDFHDALSRELSLLVNVAPEDPPLRPKIRLDLPWVRRKANRRAQFFLGFLPGQALIYVLGWLVPWHRTLGTVVTSVLTAVWAAYWWMVMTAGQSARAWSPPETTPRPWYLRGWFALTERVFLFRWALPRTWGRLWERMARRFYGPSERVEEQPLEFAGLALSRALTLVPVVKLLLRPLFSVCSARLLVEHAATARLPVAVTAAEVADAAARAPDPEARTHSGAVAR